MKIFIELPTWLGDTVMATPAIDNLSNFFNDSEFINDILIIILTKVGLEPTTYGL